MQKPKETSGKKIAVWSYSNRAQINANYEVTRWSIRNGRSSTLLSIGRNQAHQITREQFEARQEAARKRWQATMSSANVPVIIVPWGSSSVAHGADSTFETIREWLAANNVKAIVRRAGPMGTHYLEPQVDIIMPGSPAYHMLTSPPTKCPNCWRACSTGATCAPTSPYASTAPKTGTARKSASRAFPPPKSLTSGSSSSVSSRATWATLTPN